MRRLLALVTVATAVAFAAPAHAKPYTFSDAKGDALAGQAGVDIVGVKFGTEGDTTVTRVGKKTVKTYTPSKLVVSMTLAGAPMKQSGVRYQVSAEVSECGELTLRYAPTETASVLSSSQLVLGCGGAPGTAGGDTLFLDPKFSIKGNTLTWSVPLKALPKQARAGALLYKLSAMTDLVEPVLGALGPGDFTQPVFDAASTDGDWEIG